MFNEITDFINYMKENNYSKSTIKRRITGLNRLNDYLEMNKISNLKSIGINEIENYIKYYKDKGYSKSTLILNTKTLKAFIKYLLSSKIIEKNPFENVQKYNDDFTHYQNQYIKTLELDNTSKWSIQNIKSLLKILYKYLEDNEITELNQIRKNDVKAFIKHLVEKKKKDGSSYYKSESINTMIGRLKEYLNWLDKKGLCKGALSGIYFLRYSDPINKNILTRKEITKLFSVEVKNLYEFMMKTIIVCLYSTGLRISELLNVKIKDIDFDNKVILVFESKDLKERYAHIGDIAINYIKIYMDNVRNKLGNNNKTDKLFISNYEGKPLRETTVNTYIKDFSKRCGLKKNISNHTFRHSFGSHFLENGADIKIISELLGHKKLSTTERYTRLNTENLREIIKTYHPREGDKIEWN